MISKLIVFIVLLSATIAHGQEEYKNYTTKDGLPSNYIYHSIQDSKGFMWFATNRGIAKFDGVKFKVFTSKDGLPNNDIWKLTADDQGRIWWNTKSKYQGYIENDSVYKFEFSGGSKKAIKFIFFKTNEGEIIFNDGWQYYSLQNDSSQNQLQLNIIKELERKTIINNNGQFCFYEFHSKKYFSYNEKNLYQYDSNFNEVSTHKIQSNTIEKRKDIGYKFKGILPNHSSYCNNEFEFFFINSKEKKASRYTYKNLINKLKHNDNPLITSVSKKIQVSLPGYLFILNQDFEIIEKHSFPSFQNNINSYKDIRGNIWLNDSQEGLVVLPNTIDNSKQYLEGKRTQKINKINDEIIVGVQNQGIYSFNKYIDEFYFTPSLKTKGDFYQIKNNPKEKIIQVVSKFSSYTLNKSKSNDIEKIKLYRVPPNGFKTLYNFKDVEIISDSIFLIYHNNFIVVDKKSNKEINSVFRSGLVTISQFKDKIYTGGDEGLFLYEKDTLINIKENEEIMDASIVFSYSDDQYIYVGTDGRGVYLFDGEKQIYLKKTDGLIVQKTIRVKDKLWLATQEGVKVVTLNINNIELSEITDSYYDSDGIPQNNTNDIFLEDSLLWTATDVGLSRINIKSNLYKQKTPIVFDFKNDTVTFPYSRNEQITANFHALNYTNQNYLTYEYRLLPTNKTWVKTNTGSINFSGLSPNFYTLEVRVTDQHFNQSIGTQYIHILPAWWQTNWAKIVAGCILLLLFYAIIKSIQNRIRKIELRKTKLAGLELQALRSQMNPHFVHNSLNAIKYYVQRNESELSEEYLVKFSKLIRLFFDFSRQETISLKEEILLLTLYLQIEQLRFEEKLSFEFDVDKKLELEATEIPSMLLQPLVENAVNHGIFHKKGTGKVTITLLHIAINQYKVTIEDDGIGIIKAKKMGSKSSDNYQSKSSEVIQDRLELLNQSEDWDISYEIEDLSEIQNGQGTRVSLIFKQKT